MTKLLFIEGVSGVGKSTIMQKLCDKLRGMGYSVDLYREFDFPNPIDFFCTAYFKQYKYETVLQPIRLSSKILRRIASILRNCPLPQYAHLT